MIAHLSGTVYQREKQSLTIDVGGVGYMVFVPLALLGGVAVGDTAALHTHLHIREDAWELYGFLTRTDLDFFRLLLGVNGVGPKSALHIFDIGSVEEISRAIAEGDMAFLTKVSGIGKKTAERMVMELKTKVGALGGGGIRMSGAASDVVDALVQMGYAQSDARAAVRAAGTETKTGVLLKKALAALKH